MRFLCVFKAPEGDPPSAEEAAEMGVLMAEMGAAGVLLATKGASRVPGALVSGCRKERSPSRMDRLRKPRS